MRRRSLTHACGRFGGAVGGQSGTTALIAACQENHEDIVKVLMRHGARVGIYNKFSRYTPLMAAARNSNFEIVKLLLKAGADPLAKELVSVEDDAWPT